MQGQSYRQIASAFLGRPVEEIDGSRSSGAQEIPSAFKFISEVIEYGLASDAGCLLAVHELSNPGSPVPIALATLPLCIRNGTDSIGALAWFRFGLRQRVCAHELSKHFPLPPHLTDDLSAKDWIRQRRAAWLNSPQADESPLLAAARAIIISRESF